MPLEGHSGPISRLEFNVNGSILGAVNDNKSIIIWDLATRKPLAPMFFGDSWIWDIAFSPNGDLLASTGPSTPILWDVRTTQRLGRAVGATNDPHHSSRRVTFIENGAKLLSVDDGLKIRRWDSSFEAWRARACRLANRNLLPWGEWQKYLRDAGEYHKTCIGLPAGIDPPAVWTPPVLR
jgi:hypothetical protein